jgi:hypothetical protein
MTNQYNTQLVQVAGTGSDTLVFQASAATTLLKNVFWYSTTTSTVTISIKKSGGSVVPIASASVNASVSSTIFKDIVALQAGDEVYVSSSASAGTVVIVSVESSVSVSGQSISVLNDVDTTGSVTDDLLVYNGSSWVPQPLGSFTDFVDIDGRLTAAEGEIDTIQSATHVNSLNALTGAVTLSAGANVTLTQVSNNIEIAASNGGSVDSVNGQTGVVVLDTDDIAEGSTNLYFTDARVSASPAVLLNTAKRSYPLADETKLAGIATGATANSPDATLLDRANHTGTQTASTISDFSTAADARIAAASFLDLSDAPASYIASNLVVVNTAGTGLDLSPKRMEYRDEEVVADQNRLFESAQSGGTNTVRDFINDTAASASSSSAKNFLGWWDGTTITIEGMVNTNAQPPQGATAGAPLWLGTSGAISAVAPTTATHYSRLIGYHIGTDQGGNALIYFKPTPDWVQID